MRRPWSDQEIERLKRLYSHMATEALAHLMQRSLHSIWGKAKHLRIVKERIPRKPHPGCWKEIELETLRQHYPHESAREVAMRLPHRSPAAIRMRAKIAGIRKTPQCRSEIAARGARGRWAKWKERNAQGREQALLVQQKGQGRSQEGQGRHDQEGRAQAVA